MREWLEADRLRAAAWAADIEALGVRGWRTRVVEDCMGGYAVYVHNDQDMFMVASFGLDGTDATQDMVSVWDYTTETMKNVGWYYECRDCDQGSTSKMTTCIVCDSTDVGRYE